MEKNITAIPGDGIGKEIVPPAMEVLDTVAEIRGHKFNYEFAKMGGEAYDEATAGWSEKQKKDMDNWSDKDKRPLVLPQKTLDAMCRARDTGGAILLGSVGRGDLPKRLAEIGLLFMRKYFWVNNNRPFIIDKILAHNSTLFRDPVSVPGFTIVSPEESLFNGHSGAVYMPEPYSYTRKQFTRSKLEETLKQAFQLAKNTGRQIMCTSKFNVLESEKVLSNVFEEYVKQYAGQVTLNPHTMWKKNKDTGKEEPTGQLIIDNAGMQIASNPERYANTVVVADAMFGDFLQTIVDVVSGSTPVNKDALEQIKEEGLQRTFIRELCGGLYFGERSKPGEDPAYDTLHYDEKTIKNLAAVARRANEKLGLDTIDSLEIDGIPTYEYWAQVIDTDADEHSYRVRHKNIREGVTDLLTDPASLGTLLATNMIGDVYTDLAAAVAGKSLGMFPSSAENADGFGIYEQIAGTAPDIAGKGIANPIAEIRSAAMMLENFGDREGAQMIYNAITKAIHEVRTPDIMEQGFRLVDTKGMTDCIKYHIKNAA